jgi:hypothetical protein
VVDASRGATLAADSLTNGALTSDLSGWTISAPGTGWTFNSGAKHNTGNTETFSQNVSVISGHYYFVTVKATGMTAGTLTMTLGSLDGSYSITNNNAIAPAHEYQYFSYKAAATATIALTFTPSSLYDGTIQSVSVQHYTAAIPAALSGKASNGDHGFEIRSLALPTGVTFDHTAAWGAQSIAIGYLALNQNVTGYQNTVVGDQAMQKNVTGYWNTAYGQGALYDNITGYSNTAIGMAAAQYSTIGNENVAVGKYSLYTNTTGSQNVAVGANCFQKAATATENTGLGYAAGYNTTGSDNTFIGFKAGYTNVGGTNNSALGVLALYSNTSGSNNMAIGTNSLYSNLTTNNNVAIGYYSLNLATASYNTAVGTQALQSNSTGDNNVAIGHYAGKTKTAANANTTGSQNTYIGSGAGPGSTTQRSNSAAIGYGALVDASNTMVLGNTAVTDINGGTSKQANFNGAQFISTMINNTDSDTDEVDSYTFAGGYGIVIACSTTDGTSAVWKLKGTTFEAIEVDADWTAVKDNAGTYNVYFDTGAIKLQNKVGDDKAVKLGFFGI